MADEIKQSPSFQSPSKKIDSSEPTATKMDFPTAIRRVIDGYKIHKLEWSNKEYFGMLKDGILKLHKPDGLFYNWIVNDGDMLGADWIVIE